MQFVFDNSTIYSYNRIKMEQIKIALFHYHFLPGGVTTVASYAVKALLEYGEKHELNIEKIVFVSGDAENMKNIVSASQNTEYYVDTSIGYLKENITKEEEQNIGRKIKNLFKKYSGYVWWVHNYHLGKNPIFTKLLIEHLTENSFQKAIFHIHDFPECARFDNYQFLTKYIDKKLLYPIGENIRYAVINDRDVRYLKEAGIPEQYVKLIYNPVPHFTQPLSNSIPETSNSDTKNKVIHIFKDYFPSLDPEKPFALYPVRTIRRKNILEAALLSHITGNGFNLIVTLPGISVQEKSYSNIVEKLFKEGTISGIWGTGESELIPFSQIIKVSDFIISSSVIEGFGYLFLDSLRWGKPLVAKYLDIIEGFSDTFSKTSSFFYNYIAVPSNLVSMKKIKKMYKDNIKLFSNFITKEVIEEAERQIESILSMDEVDFSYLPVDSQIEILKLVKNDNNIRKIVKDLNSNTTNKIAEVIMHRQDFNRQKAAEYFSFESYSDTFSKIILSFEEKLLPDAESKSSTVAENLLNLFLRPEFLRLILS